MAEVVDKLYLLNQRINSTIEKVALSLKIDLEPETKYDIQDVIMLCNERDAIWRRETKGKLTDAFRAVQKEHPDLEIFKDK